MPEKPTMFSDRNRKWVAYHKSWIEAVHKWCDQLLDPLGAWQERLAQALLRSCPSFTWLSRAPGWEATQRLDLAWSRMIEAELAQFQQFEEVSTTSGAQWVSLCLARWRKGQLVAVGVSSLIAIL
eukprot:3179517-Amphidinium_carterae.1